MFTITGHKGFHMTFENGWTISVQWGPMNYCDHYNDSDSYAPRSVNTWKSVTAEVAAHDPNGDWYSFEQGYPLGEEGGTEVKGYCEADEVAGLISLIASK